MNHDTDSSLYGDTSYHTPISEALSKVIRVYSTPCSNVKSHKVTHAVANPFVISFLFNSCECKSLGLVRLLLLNADDCKFRGPVSLSSFHSFIYFSLNGGHLNEPQGPDCMLFVESI